MLHGVWKQCEGKCSNDHSVVQNGDLYFEKFLRDFVSPLLDKWKTLGVSHMLTVVFFSRTLFLERVTSNINPGIQSYY